MTSMRLKKLAPLILAVLIVATFLPQLVHAQAAQEQPKVWCSTNPLTWPTCLGLAVGAIVGLLLGALLVIASWVLEVVLAVNQNVLSATGVQVGFSITLGFANLGFVFGIIVIAIATILRYQTYGMKQILWKLVVMAILVNFSMTIAGTLIGFANDLSRYFMGQAIPNGGQSFANFVSGFVAGLSPQKAIGTSWLPWKGGLGIFGDPAGTIGVIAASYISVLFAAVTLIVVGAMIVMLLVRYVALGVLLVLMPIAWLCWVFPDLQSNWNKWWHSFLRWTFFAPILMFFLYLSLAAWTQRGRWLDQETERLKTQSASAAKVLDQQSEGIFAAVRGFFTNVTGDIAQQVLIVGLMVGGLFAANSLGIMGASAAMGMARGIATGFGNAVARPVGRFALGRAAAPVRGPGGIAERLQKWASAPGRGAVGRFVGGLAARPAAQLAAAGGENLVKQYEKEVAAMSRGETMAAALTAFGPRRIALQKKLAGMGEIDLKQTHTEANQRLWEAHGMKQAYNREIETPAMMSAEMYRLGKQQEKETPQLLEQRRGLLRQKGELAREGKDASAVDAELKKIEGQFDKSSEKIREAADRFYSGLTKADAQKALANDVFGNKDALGERQAFLQTMQPHISYGIAVSAQHVVPSILPKMKGQTLDNFGGEYGEAIKTAERVVTDSRKREEVRTARERFQKMRDNSLFSAVVEPAPAGGATPPPQPPLSGIPKSPTTT